MGFRLQFSLLNEHKFKRGFSYTINPMCACKTEVETTEHFLLPRNYYSTKRLKLFENLEKVGDPNFPSSSAKKSNLYFIVWFSNK